MVLRATTRDESRPLPHGRRSVQRCARNRDGDGADGRFRRSKLGPFGPQRRMTLWGGSPGPLSGPYLGRLAERAHRGFRATNRREWSAAIFQQSLDAWRGLPARSYSISDQNCPIHALQ